MKPRPQMAIARPRWWKGKISQRIAWESGMIGPPPRPWKMRATISVVRFGAIPERNELTTKSVAQIRKNRLRPNNRASHPVAGMTTALAARYDVITHETSSRPADIDPCRCGRMTLVTLVSRICMKATTMTVSVMAHFWAAGTGASVMGAVMLTRSCDRISLPKEARMDYGLFTMPSHPPERALYDGHQWDLQQLRWADELGFSEAWIGEHHTAPWEPHPSPDLLVAQALLQTERMRIGPGGFLLPYHHPAELANRVAMLDHLAQGRLNFGVAASGLPSDWAMFNVDGNAGQHREMTREALDIILRLVREVFIADTDAEAMRLSAGGMMGRMMKEYFLPLLASFGFTEFLKHRPDVADSDVTPEYCARHNWLVGSPATVADRLHAIYEEVGGFGTLLLFCFDYVENPKAWRHSIELLAKEVMPGFKDLVPKD